MGQALYRKYRSKKLDEIVGQKSVTTSLANALKSGQISHAYLFTGPRGVGKTSIARILAHEINGLTYDSDNLPIDIIEIDAASNNGVEKIRELREQVRIAPTSSKYKIYIIDEVHMLSSSAFNALLKTLEEPPAHVIFILATTESHKLPETIISRTQRYTFKLATQQEVAEHLAVIAKKEHIDIDLDALEVIAKHSGGSLRDALSLLDQVRHSTNKITGELVRQNLGLPSAETITALLQALATNDPKNVIEVLAQASENGVSATLLAEQLLDALRQGLLLQTNPIPAQEAIQLIQQLLLVESSHRPETQLEIALIGTQLSREHVKHTVSAEVIAAQPALTISSPAHRPAKKLDTPVTTAKEPKIAPTASAVTKPKEANISTDQTLNITLWNDILIQIKEAHNTIYSILRMAECDLSHIDKKQINLLFKFAFHQKRMNESKNKQIILDMLDQNGISGYELNCDVIAKGKQAIIQKNIAPEPKPKEANKTDSGYVDQIRNVFGGAEVLE